METPFHSQVRGTLHDWATLRSQLIFAFDRPSTESVDGVHVRGGEYSAWLIRGGWIRIESDGEEITVEPGKWLVCFGKNIRQVGSPDLHVFSLRFSLNWPDETQVFQAESTFCLFDAAEYPQLETVGRQLLVDMGEPEWRRESPAYTFEWRTRLSMAAYLSYQRHLLDWVELIATILGDKGWKFRLPGGVDSRVATALFLVDKLPFHAKFPGEKSLTGGSLSLGRLNRMCLKAYGTTVYAHWENRRVEQARFLLEQPGKTVKGVAGELGFSQISHFSAWFKRHAGQSPRAFRLGATKAVAAGVAEVSD